MATLDTALEVTNARSSDPHKIVDISPSISSQIAVFPGDTPFTAKILMDCKQGDHLGLSSITTTPHLGAHVDAPSHYSADGVGIAERSLNYYFGLCQVIEVELPQGSRIEPKHISQKKIVAPRVLFKTRSFANPDQWQSDFNSLSADLVDFLSIQNVILVGIDTPSIDLAEDKILQSHHAVHAKDMAILEGVVLDQVAEGLYTLVALPLKLAGLDASPVRAVLLPANWGNS
jgi:arylformamidase